MGAAHKNIDVGREMTKKKNTYIRERGTKRLLTETLEKCPFTLYLLYI